LNDLVARAFTSAGIPSSKEPHGLVRSDGKRPDGLTMVPWKGGKPLAWDVTAVCTVADVAATAREAGAAVERAAQLKIAIIFWFGGQVYLPANCYGVAWSTQ